MPAAEPVSLGGVTSMLDKEDELSQVTATDSYGFTVTGIHMRGSVLVFPRFTLLWDVLRVQDVAPRNMAVLHMVRPRVETVFVGTGAHMQNLNPSLYGYLSRHGIAIEPMSTRHAIAAFNTLVREGRPVAAALVSAKPVSRADACLYTDAAPPVSEVERRVTAALARDYSADQTIKLLEGGPAPGGGPGAVAAPADAGVGWQAASHALSAKLRYPGAGVSYGVATEPDAGTAAAAATVAASADEPVAAAAQGFVSGRITSSDQYRANVVKRALRKSGAPARHADDGAGDSDDGGSSGSGR